VEYDELVKAKSIKDTGFSMNENRVPMKIFKIEKVLPNQDIIMPIKPPPLIPPPPPIVKEVSIYDASHLLKVGIEQTRNFETKKEELYKVIGKIHKKATDETDKALQDQLDIYKYSKTHLQNQPPKRKRGRPRLYLQPEDYIKQHG
jgi:hypothetical protein